MFGLKDKEIDEIKNILKSNNISNGVIFGSRAKGNYKPGSDVDLAIDGDARKISYYLNEESKMAYFFDVVNINNIKNNNLLEHIKRVGILL